ncbi:YbfB/YjiJ family MFS transporter [Deinococcus peraridilitoris]|nr:YbfB/YjiJ family MFS transporter [Deinococcus peraridilitoris]
MQLSPGRSSPLLSAFGLALGVVVALGFARFAYALFVPAMRADLGWSYTTAGSLNTANAAGYLLGAILSAGLLARVPARAVFLGGMLMTAVALLCTAPSTSLVWLLCIRALAGLGGALTFTAGGVLAARVASRAPSSSSGTVLSVYYAGGGLGILTSGLVLPGFLARYGPGAWPAGWLGLGILGLLALLVAAWAVPPSDKTGPPAVTGPRVVRWRSLLPAFMAYALFACGYIAYMTFAVALLRTREATDTQVTLFWMTLGASSMVAPLVWGRMLQRVQGGGALAMLMFTLSLGAALPVVWSSTLASLFSAVLFGGTFLSVVAATTALVRHHLPPHDWSAGIAAFTVVFAVFQMVGPVLAGWAADLSGGLSVGLGSSAALLLLGAVIALGQQAPAPSGSPH